MIRSIQLSEYDRAGQLAVRAYTEAGLVNPDDPYLHYLTDVQARVEDPLADVLVALDQDDIIGTATLCPYGSPMTQVCRDGELEFRALAVDPAHQRRGIAEQLVWACAQWARDRGYHTLTICVNERNPVGHKLYRKLGFIRRADRDWIAPDGSVLQTYTYLLVEPVYCGRCGKEQHEADHSDCQAALALEPPRYCTQCKRRMVVQVTPTGWRASCTRHGELAS